MSGAVALWWSVCIGQPYSSLPLRPQAVGQLADGGGLAHAALLAGDGNQQLFFFFLTHTFKMLNTIVPETKNNAPIG